MTKVIQQQRFPTIGFAELPSGEGIANGNYQ